MNTLATKPLFWVPTLYFMQGVPYAVVMLVSAIVLKQFAFTNSHIAFYTSLFILPWVVKFFFAPFFEQQASKRFFIITFQFALGIISALIAVLLAVQALQGVALLFFVMALVASWQDITTDGFYLIALNRAQQIHYVGIRTLAFQLARLCCQGGVVIGVGFLLQHHWALNVAWMMGFMVVAGMMTILASYHWRVLPHTEGALTKSLAFLPVFKAFFAKEHIAAIIFFVFIYNVAEAQLIKIVPLFLLDTPAAGGLHLNVTHVGFIYGTLGMVFMLLGIFVSSWCIRNYGLKKCLMAMTAILLLSQGGYILISANIGQNNLIWVIVFVLLGQFCYGLSNNAYMVSLLDLVREHEYSMSFYAIVTGIMALGMMIPGSLSGYIQQHLGYLNFFIWIIGLQGGVLFYTQWITKYLHHEHTDTQRGAQKNHAT